MKESLRVWKKVKKSIDGFQRDVKNTDKVEFFDNKGLTLKQTDTIFAFLDFHFTNPQVFDLLYTSVISRMNNHQPISMKELYNHVRLLSQLSTDDPIYKLNNNYEPFYSRLLLEAFKEDHFLLSKMKLRSSLADPVYYDKILEKMNTKQFH